MPTRKTMRPSATPALRSTILQFDGTASTTSSPSIDVANGCRPRISTSTKLFGQSQQACAFSELVRDRRSHSDLQEHADSPTRHQFKAPSGNWSCFLYATG